MNLKSIPKISRVSYLLLAVTLAVVIALLASPASSVSTNQCAACHGTKYNQQLDVLEGNSQNKIPTALQVGQTQTVTVAVSNINNAALNNQLSSVSLTLSSQNGHFSVATPTYNIGTLSTGTATATWQITGTSQGSDALLISSSATNTHNNLKFSDSYSPSPAITVGPTATSTPVPTPSPTTVPTSTPVQTPSPTTAPTSTPTSGPTATPGPNPTATSPPSTTTPPPPTPNPTTPTQPPTPTSPPTSNPTQDPTSTPQPNQTPNPTDTPNSTQATSTPTPANQPIQSQSTQDDTTAPAAGGSSGTFTIVAPTGTHISWETSTQQLTLGNVQPLTLNLQYSATDGTNPLSANTLALNWAAIGGSAPLKISIDYQSSDGTWITIAQNILGDGSYTWTLPDTEMNSVKMQIRVSDSSAASQNISAAADINVSYTPKYSAMSPFIPYFQVLDLSTALVAMALYVKKMKTKRTSTPLIKSTRGA